MGNEATVVTDEQVKKWKETYGSVFMFDFSATCPGAVFYCRLPSLTEIKVANEAADIGATENLARKCILSPAPADINEVFGTYPGMFNSVARELLVHAGWSAEAVVKNL
jgi:hypothetical protein